MSKSESPEFEPREALASELEEHLIVSNLDHVLQARNMTMTQLSELTGITMANLSILKNNKARAVRFCSLTAICLVLDCSPGDILTIKSQT